MSALSIITENPVVAIGAGGVLILLLAMRGGSGNSNAAAMINAQIQSQKIASDTNVALSNINAKAAMSRSNNVADLYKTQVLSATQLAATNSNIIGNVQLGTLNYNAKMAATAAQENVQMATITAGQVIAAAQLSAQQAINNNNNDVVRYGMSLTSQNLPAILQQQLQLAPINAANSQALASISAQNAQAIAALQTSAARTNAETAQNSASSSSDMGWVSTVAGIAGMIFSDERLKTNIVRIGTHKTGAGIYRYNYLWSAIDYIGCMAQELLKVLPESVLVHPSGFYVVDYNIVNAG